MSPAAGNIATKHYRKSHRGLNTTVDLDDVTRRVFTVIDENIQLSMVAELAGVSIPVLWRAIAKLTRLGLIEDGVDNAGSIGKHFTDKLHKELTKAVGPMSKVLIQQVIQRMKISWPHIPTDHARELVHRLAVKIPNERARDEFQTIMLKGL